MPLDDNPKLSFLSSGQTGKKADMLLGTVLQLMLHSLFHAFVLLQTLWI